MIDTSSLASLSGKTVVGSDGERIGSVADVYESTADGGGTFATVNTGLFGTGASFFPLDAAELRGDEVAVPYTRDFVKGAPRVDNDEELTEPEEQRLFDYYASGESSSTETSSPSEDFSDTAGHDTSDPSGPTTDNEMTGSQERLQVGTEGGGVGWAARLRKRVTTETQIETAAVPVGSQEVRDAHEQNEPVPVEHVRLDTATMTEQVQVSDGVRTEQIDVGGDPQGGMPYGGENAQQSTGPDAEPRH